MPDLRAQIIDWVEEDRDVFLNFLGEFVRAKSPNPPGDTREAGALVERFLSDHQLPFRIIAPNPEMPNYVGNFHGSRPGRHVVFNGHIDVFPLGDAGVWTQDPWGGAIEDGRLYLFADRNVRDEWVAAIDAGSLDTSTENWARR